MVFNGNLYHIVSSEVSDGGRTYTIMPDAGHVIFKAHFPEDPIMPGVCILQIAFELLELSVERKLEISEVRNVKFIHLIRPDNTPVKVSIHDVNIGDGVVRARIELAADGIPAAKMSIVCKIAG